MTQKSKKTVKAQKVVKAKPSPKKEAVTTVVTPVVATTPVAPVPTIAEQMWSEIRNLPIQMFGLPNQTVEQHCSFYAVDPNQLFLTIRSSATLPSLESAITPRFVVELVDRFIVVKRASQPLFVSKK
ncbi:MAG TPA: hypothetical protein VII94_02440 [Candidatus Saccharimonadales bacterium]